MKVYVVVCDGGDGSANPHFFRNEPDLEYLVDEVDEGYALSDGITEIEIPDGPNDIRFRD